MKEKPKPDIRWSEMGNIFLPNIFFPSGPWLNEGVKKLDLVVTLCTHWLECSQTVWSWNNPRRANIPLKQVLKHLMVTALKQSWNCHVEQGKTPSDPIWMDVILWFSRKCWLLFFFSMIETSSSFAFSWFWGLAVNQNFVCQASLVINRGGWGIAGKLGAPEISVRPDLI